MTCGTGQEYWPRLLWLKENEPEIWQRADKIGLNTYLKWRATGRFVTEPSDDFIRSPKPEVADLYTRIIKAAGLVEDLGKFPEQTRSTDIVGSLTAAAARDLGLREGVPVLGGFGDLPAITAGVGRSGFNDVHIYLGTSSWLVSVVPDRSSLDAPLNFSFDADREGAVFALQTGCLAYDWATEQLYRAEKGVLGDSLHDFLAKEVASVEPGSLDLVATHWLAGELPPLSKNAKGIFLNLTTSHDRRHMLRAVMESICYTHRMNLERFSRSTGAQLESIRVVGGGVTSGVWMQMLADVLQMRIEVPRAPRYTGALGAYYCAMIGLGQIADYDSIVDEVPIERVFTPNPETRRSTTGFTTSTASFPRRCVMCSTSSTASTEPVGACFHVRIVMTEFRQESNSFSPVRSTLEQWRQGGILDPEQVHESLAGKPCAIGGMIQALEDHAADAEVVHGTVMFSQSGGIAEQAMDHYLERLIPQLEACLPLDGVLLSFHGALQTTEFDDPEAEITRRVRAIVGDRCVIATSTDLHGYISQDLVRDADLIVGYQTYPHVDFFETGYRTAKLALEAIAGGTLEMAWVPIPMIVSASAYNTLEGPFRDLIDDHQPVDLRNLQERPSDAEQSDRDFSAFDEYRLVVWVVMELAASSGLGEGLRRWG
ncbi:M81 family metallopeptidase [Saccharopolyspora hattusasensis]|uniref:M81 family metallopeptidase n=1 Tax=Saccharopolyspora hattusasensis TaxID=1128679 RepID=UPI003D986ECF